MRFGIGQPVDRRFLTGQGRYVADIDLARQAQRSSFCRRMLMRVLIPSTKLRRSSCPAFMRC
jgi:hypothetical protein